MTEQGLLLKTCTVVDAALIAGPTFTKNKDKARNPEMHSNKKGYQRYFGWKAHIGADAECKLVHTLRCTSVDIAEADTLLHGDEVLAFGDAGY